AISKEKDKAQTEKQLALEKLAQQKKQAERERQKQAQMEQDKLDQAKEEQQRKLEEQAEAVASKARSEQIKRIAELAGAGGAQGNDTAAPSSGPSAAYAGRIVARIKPNISYPDNIDGNPRVEVEIRTSPTGTILNTRITQSSGVKSWDDAVIRAIAKTEMLPRDVDGSVPSSLLIGFRPKD
ncbi:MAG: cell envelope integrity protein TolA, partial [Rhodoferax sp.]|nr:cell envelope integrity protein TolA [Rhodoferax sp.]